MKNKLSGETNYMNNRDFEDLTISDVEAVKWWKCKHSWLAEGVGGRTTLNDAYTVKRHPVL